MKKRLLLALSTLIILTMVLSACELPFTLPQATVEEVAESETAAPTEESTEPAETATEAPTEEALPPKQRHPK